MVPSPMRQSHPAVDIFALLVAAAALHGALGYGNATLQAGGLLDTDAYMRLVRIEELWANGDWYETVTKKLGAPEGLSLHWTRPLDILILLPAIALSWFGLDMHRAIYWSGVAVAPVLHFLACIAAAWAAKPLFPQHGAWRIAALTLLLGGTALSYSLPGRPDHHPLIVLAIATGAGYFIRAILALDNPRPAWAAGICAGFGIWVAPEALLAIAPALAVTGLFWLGSQHGRQWAQLGYRFGAGMATVLLVAISIEQPPRSWLHVEYDKVSILYLAFALTLAIDFRLAMNISWSGWRRVGAGVFLAGLSFAVLALLFPRFYLGSLGNIDAAGAAIFIDEVAEMKPLWPRNFETTMAFLRSIGGTLAAIPAGLYFLWALRQRPEFAAILYLSVAYLITFAAAMLHLRLAIAVCVFGAILGCGLFAMICQAAEGRGRFIMLAARLAGYFVVAIGVQIIGMIHLLSTTNTAGARCEPLQVTGWLNTQRPGIDAGNPAPIIMTDSINSPPAIAYLTPYRLVGGPYHRGNDDVADMLATMIATSDEASRAVIDRRKVDLVLICTRVVPRAIRESSKDSLYHRLVRGDAPGWLSPVPMTTEIEKAFRLYAVSR